MANLKYYNTTTGLWEEIKVSTKFKDLYHTTKLTQDQNYAPIGITNYNPNEDVIFSIVNSTWLQKDEDFIVNGGLLRIESKDGSNWKNGDTFNFVVLKNVDKDAVPTADGSLIQDGSITISKLATSIQTYINKIGVTALTTTAVTLSDAINALNTQLSENTQNLVTHESDLITDSDGVHGLKIENGVFTPMILDLASNQPATYLIQKGHYQKIGNLVWFSLFVEITAKGTVILNTNNILIGGLPFLNKNNISGFTAVTIGYSGYVNSGTGKTMHGNMPPNSNQIALTISPNDGTGETYLSGLALTNTSAFEISGQYQV